jgi:hypothetical protein
MKKRSSVHRTLYKKWHGTIPTDELGRTYDIHHKDGNHENNSMENLIAIPIQEHYDIHYHNQDYSACALIGCRMKMPVGEISRLTSLAAQKRVADRTHHWLTEEHSNNVKESIKQRVNNGTYHMLGGEIQKKFQLKRSQNKMHQWNGSQHNYDKLKNGTHPSQKEWVCPHCNVAGKGSTNAKRWHFDNCKNKQG